MNIYTSSRENLSRGRNQEKIVMFPYATAPISL